jgi:HrpA-like RNA helicase
VNKYVVFFIDEVHERSVNIDLCLAMLARLLTIKPDLKFKMKIIISSATLDQSVPKLFQKIPNVGFTEFKMPQIGYLHPVTKIARPKENILDVVQELYRKRQRNDQILCFVNSVSEVHQCCRILAELSRQTIKAYPLIQAQSAFVQQSNIEHGSVFFSTTVAETSLTFPSLKYVIDTGMVNIPIYNPESKRTVLEQVRAAESTIKQRLGRLGRTTAGEYYYLYDFRVEEKPYPTPHICVSDLTYIEFSLRRSPIKRGLHYMQQFLPNPPSQKAINATVNDLIILSECIHYYICPSQKIHNSIFTCVSQSRIEKVL